MATNASTVAIPAPANASFVNGEQGVGMSGSPAGGTAYYASRIFHAEHSGLFLFKLWVNGPATIRIGRNLSSLQTVLTVPATTVVRAQVYLQKGANRVDVQMASAAGSCFFAMLMYHLDEVVYASSAAGWVYQPTTVIPDVDVPGAVDEVLPVFSTLPNWGAGVRERIEYLTEILQSETAREQPRLLRYHPRRTYEADFLRELGGRTRLDAFLTGIGRKPFLMPLWHEQFRVTSAMGIGSTSITFPDNTLALREFQAGDRVFVNSGNPEDFEVLKVASLNYDTDTLTWAAGPTRAWPAGTRVIPMRKARITAQAQLSAPVDRVMRGSLRFDLVEPEYRFGAGWGAATPIWQFPINRGEDITFSYDRRAFTLDNSVGPVDHTEPGKRALITMRSALILKGRQQTVAFRRFIDMASGRAGSFYMPTKMSDIAPIGSTISGTFIDTVPAGFTEFVREVQASRSVIAVVFRDGSPDFYSTISDVQRVGNADRFMLDETLPTTDVAAIRQIQFMVPSRFDQDSFELNHLVDASAAVRTAVITRSVDLAGLPDIA